MSIDDLIKKLGIDPDFELLMRRFATAREGEWRARAKQAVLLYLAKQMDEVVRK